MDYKKIIKSRNVRMAILKALSFIPDKQMLQLQYRIKMGKKLNLKNPSRFTEKLQWYKLYYKNPLMVQCADKYDVRQYVEDKGLGNILNECYGVYDRVEDIDFDKLPNQFVLKDTLGGGGNAVIVVKDKKIADLKTIKAQMQKWVQTPIVRDGGREWPYYAGKKHRIIIEKFIESNESEGGLIDYKFFCFDGKTAVVYGVADRKPGIEAGIGIFDRDFKKLPYERVGEPLTRILPKPDNYEELLQIAEQLAEDFPHVRVDMYNQDGHIVFGELTFYNASGYMKYNPDDLDFELGEKFILPNGYSF